MADIVSYLVLIFLVWIFSEAVNAREKISFPWGNVLVFALALMLVLFLLGYMPPIGWDKHI